MRRCRCPTETDGAGAERSGARRVGGVGETTPNGAGAGLAGTHRAACPAHGRATRRSRSELRSPSTRSANGASASPGSGSDGLLDEPRPGAPRRIGDEEIAALVDRTLSSRPKAATHWSLRTMAKATGLSVSTVGRVWRAFGLQPHRSGDLQALHRSAVRRESARYRRSVPRPTRPRHRAVRRRKEPDAGA